MSLFKPLRVSSKFSICGLPLTGDTYRSCSFGCDYCFSNGRMINISHKQTTNVVDTPDMKWLERKLENIHTKNKCNETNFLDMLLKNKITWHIGGLADPFQPAEKEKMYTKELALIATASDHTVLFSTKSDDLYHWEAYDPKFHSFQLSVTNDKNFMESGVPSIEERNKFYNNLKDFGFKTGIRLQPFIPGITTVDIIDKFPEADNYTIEGLKMVPQNQKQKDYILKETGLKIEDFMLSGLYNLKPELRMQLYQPFIRKLEDAGYKYSIADNDLHYLGNNKCCCGDKLIKKCTEFNNTTILQEVSLDEYDSEMITRIGEYKNCNVKPLFTSNRNDGFKTVEEFTIKKLKSKKHPCSKEFLYL